jgi:hypothetical protein
VAALTPADVKRWDADAIHGVFQTATNRAMTLQRLGDSLQQVHNTFSDWQGEAGDAFRADLGKTRRDIDADGQESRQVAAAVSRAEADVRSVKSELDGIEQAAEGYGWTITPDWRIDPGNTMIGLDRLTLAAEQQLLQGQLDTCKLHAHNADQELATAVRGSVGDIPLDATGHQPGVAPPAPGAPKPSAAGQPKSWQDMLLPAGPASAEAGGEPPKGSPVPAGAGGGKPPSLEDMMLGRGEPADPGGKPPPSSLPDLLGRLEKPGVPGAPPPRLNPADVETFKALARQSMISDGVPPDQIESRLNDAVARTQQWMDNGMPNYIPPTPPRPSPPLFGEGFADRWFSAEQGIHDLMGQNGLSALGDSWGGMAKGLAGRAEDFLLQGPVAPINDLTHEFKSFIDNPAYYAGGKTADGALALPGMMFGPEGAGLSELSELDAATGGAYDLPGVHPPLSPLEQALPDLHSALSPPEAPLHGGVHPSGPVEGPMPSGHMPSGPAESPVPAAHPSGPVDGPASGGHPLAGPHEPPVTAGHPPLGTGDGHVEVPSGHSLPDLHHSDDPYAMDSDGHYLPGSLPSYDQLQGITTTDPNSAHYWSGRNAEGLGVGPDDSGIAELIAHGSGGTTLEMTLADRGVDPLPVWNRHDPVSVQFWGDASAAYAENAQGEVTAIVGSSLRPGNVWQTVEIPRLMENPDVTRIVQIDPDTGQSTTIFERGK